MDYNLLLPMLGLSDYASYSLNLYELMAVHDMIVRNMQESPETGSEVVGAVQLPNVGNLL